MAVAHWYRSSDGLEGMRLLGRRFYSKGAVDAMSPFPVADFKETTPPLPVLDATVVSGSPLVFGFDRDPYGLFL